MEPLSTAIAIGTAAAPWFGEWVTVEIAGAMLKGITTTVNPDEARRSLRIATIAAHDSRRGDGLFSQCDEWSEGSTEAVTAVYSDG
jgi:hypothetical protein